jgi:hypothetical protein
MQATHGQATEGTRTFSVHTYTSVAWSAVNGKPVNCIIAFRQHGYAVHSGAADTVRLPGWDLVWLAQAVDKHRTSHRRRAPSTDLTMLGLRSDRDSNGTDVDVVNAKHPGYVTDSDSHMTHMT